MELYLFWLVLAGSPAFGIEALLFRDIGGRFFSHEDKLEFFRNASALGLVIVLTSFFISYILSLGPLFLCLILFSFTVFSGKLISLKDKNEEEKEIHSSEDISEDDIKDMLKDRDLDSLIGDEDDRKEDD